jgi:hypothetical protein
LSDPGEKPRPDWAQFVRLAWTSAFAAFVRMLPLFLTSMVLCVLFGIADRWVLSCVEPTIDGATALYRGVALLMITLPETMIDALLLAPVAVAVHRFVLLEETSRGFSILRQLSIRNFAIWTFCVQLTLFIVDFITQRGEGWFFHWLGAAALLVLFARTLLIFPAVAIEVPFASAADRLEASFSSSRGLFWSTVIGLIMAVLPLKLSEIAPALVERFIYSLHAMNPDRIAAPQFDGALLTVILEDFLRPFIAGVLAALASWLYLWAQEHPFEASADPPLEPKT